MHHALSPSADPMSLIRWQQMGAHCRPLEIGLGNTLRKMLIRSSYLPWVSPFSGAAASLSNMKMQKVVAEETRDLKRNVLEKAA